MLLPATGEPFDIQRLDETVEKAGFELLGVELAVRGRLERLPGPGGAEVPAIEVDTLDQHFALVEGDSEHEREVWARLSPRLDERGATLLIRGRPHPHAVGPLGLFVTDFRFLETSG